MALSVPPRKQRQYPIYAELSTSQVEHLGQAWALPNLMAFDEPLRLAHWDGPLYNTKSGLHMKTVHVPRVLSLLLQIITPQRVLVLSAGWNTDDAQLEMIQQAKWLAPTSP